MNELVPTHETGSASLAEPLWKIRWKLIRRGIAQNWEIFKESRIGMLGIILIIAFGIFGAMWPIMINTVWDPMVYDPVVGFDPHDNAPIPPKRYAPLWYGSNWERYSGSAYVQHRA